MQSGKKSVIYKNDFGGRLPPNSANFALLDGHLAALCIFRLDEKSLTYLGWKS
jgi:prepilin-type processing-associated H-X9-DG protein